MATTMRPVDTAPVWVAWLAAPVLVLAVVELLGPPAVDWDDQWDWLGTTSPETAMAALAAMAIRLCALWVFASTAVTGLALLVGRRHLARSVSRFGVPAVRRLALRVATVTLAVSPTAAPTIAAATEPAPAIAVAYAANEPDSPLPPFLLTQHGAPAAVPPDPASEVDPAPPPVPPFMLDERRPTGTTARSASSGAKRYTVVKGDHLWSIAAGHLGDNGAANPTVADICQYWLRLIETNRDVIRSGDPDLIFPGEVIRLPPIDPS
ncbi:MAG: LysM peptidoglycan-binding domain-containing protein [Acidimicrobiia bacterium]|nr:LysM peptidoglycan-binding domain-containing protein [Acidimicrobiia bacterium]